MLLARPAQVDLGVDLGADLAVAIDRLGLERLGKAAVAVKRDLRLVDVLVRQLEFEGQIARCRAPIVDPCALQPGLDTNTAVREDLPVQQRVERVGRGEDRPPEDRALQVARQETGFHPSGTAAKVRRDAHHAGPPEQERRVEVQHQPEPPFRPHARTFHLVLTGSFGRFGRTIGSSSIARKISSTARSSCGSPPSMTDLGSFSTSMSGSTPWPSMI